MNFSLQMYILEVSLVVRIKPAQAGLNGCTNEWSGLASHLQVSTISERQAEEQ